MEAGQKALETGQDGYSHVCKKCGIAKPRQAYKTKHRFNCGHGNVCAACLKKRQKELDAKKPKPPPLRKPPDIVAGFLTRREDKVFKGRPGRPLAVVRIPCRHSE